MDDAYRTLFGDVTQPFSAARFSVGRRPVTVGRIAIDEATGSLPCCLDMLVMFPGGEVLLPEPYASDPGVSAFLRA